MKTLLPSHKVDADEDQSSSGIQQCIYPDHHEGNITDGSEFLDDAIRMNDQPLDETTVKENQ